jgi:cholesterol transport system auxiliary component
MIQRRFLLTGACALTLSACGGNLIGPPDAGPIYVVAPKFPATPAGGEKVGWALAVLRPDMAAGLDTDRIALFQPDGTMDYYAKATYPDRLAPIVQQAVLDGFEASGRIDAVAEEQDALHADYNLSTEVKDFAAHYSQQDGIPTVTVSIIAKLTTTHARDIVSSFATTKTGTASLNSAAAAAQALQQALAAAVNDIVAWALTAPKPTTRQPATASPGKPAEELLHETTRATSHLKEKTAPQ